MPSKSNPAASDEHPSPWLKEKVYNRRRQRTKELVTRAVDALVGAGEAVTLAAVSRKTKEDDPEHRGVGEGGILGNDDAYDYYLRHSFTAQARKQRAQRNRHPARPAKPGRGPPTCPYNPPDKW